MASAEVLQSSAATSSSRKQGHLEAGKRRLEEFRKRKAEGKAKKAASTGQLLADVSQNVKLPQECDDVGVRTTQNGNNAGQVDLSRPVAAYESTTVTSSHEDAPSGVAERILVDDNSKTHTDHLLTDISQNRSRLYTNAGFSRLTEEYDTQDRSKSDLNREIKDLEELSVRSAKGQQNASESAFLNSTFQAKSKQSVTWSENQTSSGNHSIEHQGKVVDFWSSPPHLPGKTKNGFEKNVGSSSDFMFGTAGTTEQHKSDFLDLDMSVSSNISSKEIFSSNLRIDNESSQPSNINSSPLFKSSYSQQDLPSTTSGSGAWRTRPSFHDFINGPRLSSASNFSFSPPQKADPAFHMYGSKLHSAEVHPLSSEKLGDNAFQQSATVVDQDSLVSKPFAFNFSASLSNNQQMRAEIKDASRKSTQDLPSLSRDEDFSALEQHIEDLTKEKFSLQRALESSRSLAESLASENSSLTESFNQQGEVVNQLRSDMERLQEEIRAQMLALEAVKLEYAHAQLECSAADERAKILASEVIGLEEKALRLRSSELKLEKQLDNFNAEANSYKKKVYSLEKERQDFQSTIEALQEEKKLLQSKLRKASAHGKITDAGRASSAKKDVFTSTEDLGTEFPRVLDVTNSMEMMPNYSASAKQETEASTLYYGDVSATDIQSEPTSLFPPDSCAIPSDQLRMIDNINSSISELALEKEDLMQALRVQGANNSKLMDMNKELSQKLEMQTQRLELLAAKHMAGESSMSRSGHVKNALETTVYTDEGDEVVERVLNWIMKLFPGGPSRRRTSKLL